MERSSSHSQNGQLVLDNPNNKSVKPFQLTAPQPGVTNVNPSFAPTNSAHIIAFIQRSSSGAKLCFATIGKFALNSSCTNAPEMGSRRSGRLGSQRPDDPRARDQEQRRQLRPAHFSTATSRVLHAGVEPAKARSRQTTASAARACSLLRVLAQRQEDRAGFEHRHRHVQPLHRAAQRLHSQHLAGAAGKCMPGRLAFRQPGTCCDAAQRVVLADRARDDRRVESGQPAQSDDPREPGGSSRLAAGPDWWLTRCLRCFRWARRGWCWRFRMVGGFRCGRSG